MQVCPGRIFASFTLLAPLLGALAGCGGGEVTEPPAPEPLSLDTQTLPGGRIGDAYDEKLAASGGTPPYRFELRLGALPEGLELLRNQGKLVGTLAAPGTSEFTLEVTDDAGGSDTRDFSIFVEPDPLEITSPTVLPDALTTRAYDEMLEATGGVPPIRFALTTGSLPGGLALASDGRLAGTPTETGSYELGVKATDAEGTTADKTFMLTVASGTPMIETTDLPAALVDTRYEVRIEAFGGTPPYTFTVVAGDLPPGLELQDDGLLFGEPDTAGEYAFGVQVEDAEGYTDSVSLSVLVLEPLLVATRSVPVAVLGELYRVALQAQGGLPPYTWSTADPLPPGISLTAEGLLTGTPTQLGEWDVRVRVQDATMGVPRSARLTLRVRDVRIYEVTPGLAFPPVCTATTVSYQTAEITVPDSFAIQSFEVDIDLTYADANGGDRDRLKVVLFAPDGRRTVLCGNGAGVRGSGGCTGSGDLRETYGVNGVSPQVPLRVFEGMNPQGTWRFQAAVVKPTVDTSSTCQQAGVINRVTMTMEPDTSPDPYVIVEGFTRHNLLIDPWVRIQGGGLPEQSITLNATLWHPGANGLREGGMGDDQPDPVEFTFSGSGLPTGTTITPDGTVTSGPATSRDFSSSSVTASDAAGTYSVTLPLHVVPPDWNPMVRNY